MNLIEVQLAVVKKMRELYPDIRSKFHINTYKIDKNFYTHFY